MNNLLKLSALALAFTSAAAVLPTRAAEAQVTPGHKHIYSETANPRAEIQAALKKAKAEHKRVILDFGGDWCPDCQVLDTYFHDSTNQPILSKNFVLVDIWIGHIDRNLDVAQEHGESLKHGVPSLVVLASSGKTLYAQNGEFSNMRAMSSSSLTEFLNKWKP